MNRILNSLCQGHTPSNRVGKMYGKLYEEVSMLFINNPLRKLRGLLKTKGNKSERKRGWGAKKYKKMLWSFSLVWKEEFKKKGQGRGGGGNAFTGENLIQI